MPTGDTAANIIMLAHEITLLCLDDPDYGAAYLTRMRRRLVQRRAYLIGAQAPRLQVVRRPTGRRKCGPAARGPATGRDAQRA